MPIVRIVESLVKEIIKKFSKAETNKIIDLMETLEINLNKGKFLNLFRGIVIKELRHILLTVEAEGFE